jgi:hypothetical protein
MQQVHSDDSAGARPTYSPPASAASAAPHKEPIMIKHALFVRLEARPGNEDAVAAS